MALKEELQTVKGQLQVAKETLAAVNKAMEALKEELEEVKEELEVVKRGPPRADVGVMAAPEVRHADAMTDPLPAETGAVCYECVPRDAFPKLCKICQDPLPYGPHVKHEPIPVANAVSVQNVLNELNADMEEVAARCRDPVALPGLSVRAPFFFFFGEGRS